MMIEFLDAASRAGIRPEIIYAMKKTGRMVTEANRRLLADEDLQEWQDAINEYFAVVGSQRGREQ
jgi:hypothetical protein